MAVPVVMPKVGISVVSCIIGTWRKKIGDPISIGDVLFDYETDKAAFECESTAGGTLLEIFFGDGDEVPCLVPVCAIGNVGDDVSEFRPTGGTSGSTAQAAETATPSATVETAPGTTAAANGKANISPRARSLAARLHLDPTAAVPTGPHGRIIARDIETLAIKGKTGTGIGGRVFERDGAASVPAPMPGSAPTAKDAAAYTDEKFTNIRRAIARAMHNSLQNAAQLTHHHSFDATALISLRQQFKASGEPLGLSGITVNDMVLFAVSRTLKNHPDINAQLLNNDTIRHFHGVHLGMPVDTPRGLMVPTIFDADKKSLAEIANEARTLAAMCRSGSINPDLLQGASFTVSNLGSLGVEMFTPIINLPQVAILGLCGMTTKVRNTANGIETYQSIGLSLTYDHRAIDGAPASRFVQELAANLERFPLLMALQGEMKHAKF